MQCNRWDFQQDNDPKLTLNGVRGDLEKRLRGRVLPWPSVNAGVYYIFYYSKILCDLRTVSKLLSRLEAAIGIEPMNKGFADHSD